MNNKMTHSIIVNKNGDLTEKKSKILIKNTHHVIIKQIKILFFFIHIKILMKNLKT